MPNEISVSLAEETAVPPAPFPPETDSGSWSHSKVRFQSSDESIPPAPRTPPRSTRNVRKPHERLPDREDGEGSLAVARVSRMYDSPGAVRWGDEEKGGDAVGAGCFLYGFLLAAACAGLAVLPLCSWTATERRERRRRWCYAGGVCVGLGVFCGWMAVLVIVMVRKGGEGAG